MRLPSLEDLCIFDIKFLLSSRLLSCWLFLTPRPRSPNFPIFNAGPSSLLSPPPPLSFSCPTAAECSVAPFVGMCCLHCSWTSVRCLSPSCTLNPAESSTPPPPPLENNDPLCTNPWSPRTQTLADSLICWKPEGCRGSSASRSLWWIMKCSFNALWTPRLPTQASLGPCASVTFCKPYQCSVDAQWRMPIYLFHIWRPCRLYKPPSGGPAC